MKNLLCLFAMSQVVISLNLTIRSVVYNFILYCISVIYNEGQWRLNKVSPMYNLQYSALKLKQYASKIRQALVSSVSANTLKYTVTVEEQPHLKYCEEDANGIVVRVDQVDLW